MEVVQQYTAIIFSSRLDAAISYSLFGVWILFAVRTRGSFDIYPGLSPPQGRFFEARRLESDSGKARVTAPLFKEKPFMG